MDSIKHYLAKWLGVSRDTRVRDVSLDQLVKWIIKNKKMDKEEKGMLIEKVKEISRQLRDEETDRNNVGGGVEDEYNVNGKKYKIRVDAFWEKSDWCEYSIKGIGFPYKDNGRIDF